MGKFDAMPDHLVTERLRLRPWSESDVPRYRELWLERHPRSARVIGADGRPTVEDLLHNMWFQRSAAAEVGYGLMVVEERIENEFIGYCGPARQSR